MPELPEVEIVCRNLAQMIPSGSQIVSWKFFRKNLRFEIPQKLLQELRGQFIRKISRRAKYILIEFDHKVIISHLGMTGSWRCENKPWIKAKHDHLYFEINGQNFIYQDPRRFGYIEVIEKNDLEFRFRALGVEPLEAKTDFSQLTREFRKLSAPIKTALMKQNLIVGIGNIYASEILFAAQTSPLRKSSTVKLDQFNSIWKNTKSILKKSIAVGGSTIENYRNAFGEAGAFQSHFFVYGRELEPCHFCQTLIKQKIMSGRSTFWCPSCQK